MPKRIWYFPVIGEVINQMFAATSFLISIGAEKPWIAFFFNFLNYLSLELTGCIASLISRFGLWNIVQSADLITDQGIFHVKHSK